MEEIRKRTRQIEVRGEQIEIFFSEMGTGTRVVFFLLGLFTSKSTAEKLWFSHIRPPRGWKYIVLNWPGIGGGMRFRENKNSVEMLAEMLAVLMEKLNVEKASFFGTSFGGTMALYFAAKYPSRVEAVVVQGAFAEGKMLVEILDTSLKDYIFRWLHERPNLPRTFFVRYFKGVQTRAKGGKFNSLEHVVRLANKVEALLFSLSDRHRELFVKDLMGADFHAAYDQFSSLLSVDLTESLMDFPCPIMVIDGEDTPRPELTTAHYIYHLLPANKREMHLVRALGHFVTFFFPEEVIGVAESFFQRQGVRRSLWERAKNLAASFF